MLTLSYGFKKPQTRDTGTILFTALEDNLQQLNDHSHNGVDSARLTAAAVVASTQTIAAGSWVATSQGNYRQLVTLSGLSYDEINIGMRNSSGHIVAAQIEKVSSSTYYVYTNDNATDFTAVYTS